MNMMSSTKRKCVEGETIDGTVLKLIFHCEVNRFACICGEEVGEYLHHKCTVSIKEKSSLEISRCDPWKCQTCKEWVESQRKFKIYLDQWSEEDDEIYCDACFTRCHNRELPKDCNCEWYTDKEGVDRCKKCNLSYDGYCYKCNMGWYKDDNGQLRCSTCDIEIPYIDAKPCECDHWYTDVEGIDRCKKCHTENDGSPCEKCEH